jgi:hypothetical protein
MGRRAERRTGKRGANKVYFSRGAGTQPPSIDEQLEEIEEVKPILDLMQRFNALLARHTDVTIPAKRYSVVLDEGFTLLLDGRARRIYEPNNIDDEGPIDCRIATSLPNLEALLSSPDEATKLLLKGKIKVDPMSEILGLAMALGEILGAEQAA